MFLQSRLCSDVATTPASEDVSYKRKKRLQREMTKMVWKELERTYGILHHRPSPMACYRRLNTLKTRGGENRQLYRKG